MSSLAPWPVASRVRRALRIAMVDHIPVPKSTTDPPTRAGGPSGWPVTDMIPEKACMRGSYPGSSRMGPRSP